MQEPLPPLPMPVLANPMPLFLTLSVERNLVPFAQRVNEIYNLGINTHYPLLYEDDPVKQERRVKGFLKAIWEAKIQPLPPQMRKDIIKLAEYYGITEEDFK